MRKKLLTLLLMSAIVLIASAPSVAHDYDRNDSDHVMRLLAYVIHPIGIALEYGVTRPIHMLVSMNKSTRIWFGHDASPNENPDDYYIWK